MFCPKCGQQQATDEMRFCSRCGFQLGVVSALVATGGVRPAIIIANDKGQSNVSTKRRTRQGAKLMFASGVITPIAMGLSILVDSPLPFIIPFTIFLAGLTWMLYFRWFGEEVMSIDTQSAPAQISEAGQIYLSPTQTSYSPPTSNSTHRTAEILQPSSVTEHTTKLLDVEKEEI